MNNQEAMFLLQAYRPNGQDAGDPMFAEALDQAGRDPELSRWFAAEREFDSAISRKVKEIPAPEGLKERILAGQNIIRPQPRRDRRLWLPLAACLMFFIGLGVWWSGTGNRDPLADFHGELFRLAEAGPAHVELKTSDDAQVREWLSQRQAIANFQLPPGLSKLPGMGCRVLDWRGRKVSMLCFMRDGEHIDLFVINRDDLPPALRTEELRFARQGAWMTAAWSEGGRVYLVASTGDESSLRKLF